MESEGSLDLFQVVSFFTLHFSDRFEILTLLLLLCLHLSQLLDLDFERHVRLLQVLDVLMLHLVDVDGLQDLRVVKRLVVVLLRA